MNQLVPIKERARSTIRNRIRAEEELLSMTDDQARDKLSDKNKNCSYTTLHAIKEGWYECRTKDLIEELNGTHKAYEEKQTILDFLTMAIRHTKIGKGLRELVLEDGYVKCYYGDEEEEFCGINVKNCDGYDMIKDVMNFIEVDPDPYVAEPEDIYV